MAATAPNGNGSMRITPQLLLGIAQALVWVIAAVWIVAEMQASTREIRVTLGFMAQQLGDEKQTNERQERVLGNHGQRLYKLDGMAETR